MRHVRDGGATRSDHRPLATALGLVAALLLLASGYLWLLGAGERVPSGVAAIGGPFGLVQGDGQHVTDRSFRGKYLLIYFGYTSCRDVCPTTLTSLAAAIDALGDKADRVQPLFITVDPRRDTPAVVRQYASSFMPQLIGLTGTPDAVRRAADEYRISSVVHRAGPEPEGYAVDHTSVIFLVGPDGRYIAPIRADNTAPIMAKAIARYLS